MHSAMWGHPSGVFEIGTDPVQMRAILEHHLRVPGGPSLEVVRCKPSFTRGGGSRSLFQYEVTLRDPEGREWNEVVSGVAYGGQRTRKAWEKLQLANVEARRDPNILRAAYVPDLDLLLQVFPYDHELPALERLMAGPVTGLHTPIMHRFGPGDWRLEEWQAEAIRYRVDLRASLKLTVRAAESRSGRVAERRFFAKIYASEDEVERAWTIQQDLVVALLAAGEPFGLAPLVAYLPDDRVLVQDEVRASSLRQTIRRAEPENVAEAVRRAARAIAALHRLPIAAPQHRIELDRTDPGRVRRSAEALRDTRPDLASAVAEIEAQILARLDAIGELRSVPIHGDLKLPHVLFEDERVVLLDLDKFAAGEPMLDVTNLLVPLRRERKTPVDRIPLARVFAEEYFAHVPAAWEQRLAPHYAWAILREATAFATDLGKSLAGPKATRPERPDNHVDMLVDEARAMLLGRA
jgi:streptomycin 6-kinase